MNPLPPLLLGVALLAACAPPVPPMPPAPSSALSVAAVRTDSDQRFSVLLDAGSTADIFSNYATDRPSPWGGNFTRRLNFTGVAWDDSRTATLVTPEHVVMAAHYPRPVGSTLIFHDRRGRPQRRELVAVESLAGLTDVAVGRLDSPVPDSVRPYRLLPPSGGYGALAGCLAVVTDQQRKAFLHEVAVVHGHALSFRYPAPSRIPPRLTKPLIKGDSGNPSFLLVGGELVLIETHTGGGPGSGPFLSSPPVFAAIQAAVTRLGGGDTLQVVPLGE